MGAIDDNRERNGGEGISSIQQRRQRTYIRLWCVKLQRNGFISIRSREIVIERSNSMSQEQTACLF